MDQTCGCENHRNDYSIERLVRYALEKVVDIAKLDAILQEQERILEEQHVSQGIQPDYESVEESGHSCTRQDWHGDSEFYNELMSSKKLHQQIIYSNSKKGPIDGKRYITDNLEPPNKRIKTESSHKNSNESKEEPQVSTIIHRINNSASEANEIVEPTEMPSTTTKLLIQNNNENWDSDEDDRPPQPWVDNDCLNITETCTPSVLGSPESDSNQLYKRFIIIISETDTDDDSD
jgi:hypothetical protein